MTAVFDPMASLIESPTVRIGASFAIRKESTDDTYAMTNEFNEAKGGGNRPYSSSLSN